MVQGGGGRYTHHGAGSTHPPWCREYPPPMVPGVHTHPVPGTYTHHGYPGGCLRRGLTLLRYREASREACTPL